MNPHALATHDKRDNACLYSYTTNLFIKEYVNILPIGSNS